MPAVVPTSPACVEAKLPHVPPVRPASGCRPRESSSASRPHASGSTCVEPGDFHWAQDVKDVNQIRYTQARPWTNAASPYIYDPLAGTDYPATLARRIVTAPAAGTIETITVTDAATAPVLAGLVLTIGVRAAAGEVGHRGRP